MDQRMSVITLGVADLGRARRFYTEGLGWRPDFDNGDIVFFQAGSMLLALFPHAALAADAQIAADRFGGVTVAQCLPTREAVDALLSEVARAGAPILKPAHDTAWGGYSGYFADPDGHPWEILWNPALTLQDDGSVRSRASAQGSAQGLAGSVAMEQRLSLVTLGVADLDRSRRFYVDRLGWQSSFDDGDVIFFQAPGMVLALWRRASLAADVQTDPGSFGAIATAHNVRKRGDVDAIMAAASAAGARILKPAVDAPWGGYTACFADPDGHPWEIAWNPGWTILEDGGIRLAAPA